MEKENISEFEYKSMEIINIKTESKRGCKTCSVSDLQNNIKQSNILGVFPKKRKKSTKVLKYNI